jgi:hypothetical protein
MCILVSYIQIIDVMDNVVASYIGNQCFSLGKFLILYMDM